MISIVENNIITEKLIEKGDKVLIALSGGPDSVFLLHSLRLLSVKLGFEIYAAHINHMYRGELADRDQAFSEKLCQEYEIPFFVKKKNTTELAKEFKITEEEAGRKLRYDFFDEILKLIGGNKIAVAHNLNDQSETVLQRILRGTGIDGLAAMSFRRKNIIRPILNIDKKNILKYLTENNFEFCEDHTNFLPIYGRNKIRLNLIPYLEENFNPNIQNVLFNMANLMTKDGAILKKYTRTQLEYILKNKSETEMVLDREKLLELDAGEIARVLRCAIDDFKGNTINLESKHINMIIDTLYKNTTGKTLNLPESLTAIFSYNDLILRKTIEKICKFEYNIDVNEKTNIKEVNKSIFISVKNLENNSSSHSKENLFFLDFDKLKGNLIVRNRRDGDTMTPLGMKGKKKIKDILSDNKIPLHLRDKLLIIEDEEKIVFLENYRINENYKVTKDTKRIMSIIISEEEYE